jgi:hypothetical protein
MVNAEVPRQELKHAGAEWAREKPSPGGPWCRLVMKIFFFGVGGVETRSDCAAQAGLELLLPQPPDC